MRENKGLNDQELLQLCRSGEAITNQDIGGIMPQLSNIESNGLKNSSENGTRRINLMNFSYDGNDNTDK